MGRHAACRQLRPGENGRMTPDTCSRVDEIGFALIQRPWLPCRRLRHGDSLRCHDGGPGADPVEDIALHEKRQLPTSGLGSPSSRVQTRALQGTAVSSELDPIGI